MLESRFMPLFVVEDPIIPFNPNGPKRNASKKVPNFNFGAILLGKSFPKESLFPIKTIIVARSHPTKFLHNVGGPPPRSPSLDAIPKLVFNRFTTVVLGRQKMHCFEMEAGAIRALHSLTATALCQIDQMNAASLPERLGSHTWDHWNL